MTDKQNQPQGWEKYASNRKTSRPFMLLFPAVSDVVVCKRLCVKTCLDSFGFFGFFCLATIAEVAARCNGLATVPAAHGIPPPLCMLYLKSISCILYSFYRQLSTLRAYFIIKNVKEGLAMISYAPLYRTMKEKSISTYKLINQYGFSRSLLDRLKHNRPISTVTLNDLCTCLDCRVEDVLVYIKD